MRHVPLVLTLLRAALAPVVVTLALCSPLRWAFGLCLWLAFVSDVFDGIIARRLGIATPKLRRLDSAADSLFYLAATFAAWHLYPLALSSRWQALLLLAALELARYALDYLKFRREASYHMWTSKCWGLALFLGFMALLGFGADNACVDAAIWLGLLADAEGLLISLILPRWRSDVPSFVHALRWRAADRAED